MYDFGYDIADYRAIAPEYGTMQDFDDLMTEAKRLGKNRQSQNYIHLLLAVIPVKRPQRLFFLYQPSS